MSPGGLRSIAVATVVAFSFLLSVSVFADLSKDRKKGTPNQPSSPQQLSGQLATGGRVKILVNGINTPSGATIFSGSQIETPELVGTAILVGSLGRVDIAPKTKLTLSFTSKSMDVDLMAGCVILSTEVGISGLIKTPQGVNQKIGPDKPSFVDVCTGDPGTASPIIGEGAAMKAGAGVCWCVAPTIPINSAFGPLWLLSAGPVAGAAIVSSTGRPDTVSASAPGL